MVNLFRGLLLLLLALAGSGCPQPGQSQLSDEEKEPHYIEGLRHVNTMDYAAAIESFEKALNVNPKSAAAHMELGLLFDRKAHDPDPAAAIYHYEHFLKLRPNSDKAESIRQLILACKQELARTVSLGPVSERLQRELEKLIVDNKRLADENKPLREEVAKWRAFYAAHPSVSTNPAIQPSPPRGASSPGAIPPAAVPQHPEGIPGATPRTPSLLPARVAGTPPAAVAASAPRSPAPTETPVTASAPVARSGSLAGSRSHVVEPHETLGSIARQYGVKLEAIQAANPGLNPRRLRPGQKVILPP